MSFKFYKFCQNGVITIITSLYACFIVGNFLLDLSWFGSIILSVIATIVCFLPIVSIFYPFIISAYLILACVGAYSSFNFYLCLLLLVLHIVRMVSMLRFARKNPTLSLEYDKAIRYGYKL